MEEVWARGDPVAVRDVMDALNRRRKKPRAYTTYMTILSRLSQEGPRHTPARGKNRPLPAVIHT